MFGHAALVIQSLNSFSKMNENHSKSACQHHSESSVSYHSLKKIPVGAGGCKQSNCQSYTQTGLLSDYIHVGYGAPRCIWSASRLNIESKNIQKWIESGAHTDPGTGLARILLDTSPTRYFWPWLVPSNWKT